MSESSPSVDVLIPCRNEERHIARCLDSLLANGLDNGRVNVVVIDGMSTDRTREIVGEYSRRYPFIRMIDNPQQDKPAALNLGIRSTDGDIVVRVDAHCVYASDYLWKLVDGLAKYRADNTGGLLQACVGNTPWQKAIGTVVLHPFAAGNAVHRTGTGSDAPREVSTVCFGCYRRDVFEKIGLFHPRLIRTQDRELNARLVAAGGRIVMDPTVRCTYFPRTKIGDYIRWTFSGAYWVYYASRFTTTKMRSWRNAVPAAFLLWHAVALGGALLAPALLPAWLAPIAAYWILAVYFAGRIALSGRSPLLFPAMLVLFPATHFSYGLGSLCGKLMACVRGHEDAKAPTYRWQRLSTDQGEEEGRLKWDRIPCSTQT